LACPLAPIGTERPIAPIGSEHRQGLAPSTAPTTGASSEGSLAGDEDHLSTARHLTSGRTSFLNSLRPESRKGSMDHLLLAVAETFNNYIDDERRGVQNWGPCPKEWCDTSAKGLSSFFAQERALEEQRARERQGPPRPSQLLQARPIQRQQPGYAQQQQPGPTPLEQLRMTFEQQSQQLGHSPIEQRRSVFQQHQPPPPQQQQLGQSPLDQRRSAFQQQQLGQCPPEQRRSAFQQHQLGQSPLDQRRSTFQQLFPQAQHSLFQPAPQQQAQPIQQQQQQQQVASAGSEHYAERERQETLNYNFQRRVAVPQVLDPRFSSPKKR
jgi:hypothetical protein